MFVHRRRRWESPESAVTPESLFWNRRAFLGAAAASATAGAFGAGAFAPSSAVAATAGAPFEPKPPLNPAFADAGRAVTREEVNSTYNNFYEFGTHKEIHKAAQALPSDPWSVTIDGLVSRPLTLSMDDILARMPMEERITRHRCVEAWSMVAPWIGFPLKPLLDLAEPLGSAKYVRFQTFMNPEVAREQRSPWYPWPYTEGLTVDEAANPLSFMVVGAYGKVLPKQFGAPIRLHTPWKYGFKSIKSITRISLVDEQPVGLWEALLGNEYGFWANVNPEVDHPRWSQASERVLGESDRIPTQLFNGYAEEVAHLYTGMEASVGDRLWR